VPPVQPLRLDPLPTDTPVLLFDGVCNLCNGFVRFILKRDPHGRVRFASLQSASARALLEPRGFSPGETRLPDSVALVEGPRVFLKSTASLRVMRLLRFPWPVFYALIVVPRPVRDWVYDTIARHRYRWFGRREVCMVPTADLRRRFLEY
jgi:predicted DCC family thiol-disulfide oxidoreductase YuxK